MEKYKLLGQLNPKQMWAAVDECYKQPTAAPPILARLPAMPRAPCALFDRLVADFELTEDEREWLRRGRNASGRGPRRLDPKVYRAASALETLVGYLHLRDPERLADLLEFAFQPAPSGAGEDSDSAEETAGAG